MENLAPTKYPVHDLIRKRWSPRAFAAKIPSNETLQSLLEAARWSASSSNEQPWRFLIATQDHPDAFAKVLSCLVEGNQVWAKAAPVLMLSFVKKTSSRNGGPNRVALHDVGLATAQIFLQATSMGLVTHAMGGIELEKIRTTYDLPADFDPVAAIAIGYPGDPEKLPEPLRQREKNPRERKDPKALFFSDLWEHPSPIITEVEQD